MKRLYILLIGLHLILLSGYGQEKWEEYITELLIESENEEAFITLYEELTAQAQNPLNLNEASRENLSAIPFLSGRQIEKLSEYLEKYGPMQTIYELRMVPEMDLHTIQLILPFVKITSPIKTEERVSLKNLPEGRHMFITRFDQCLNRKEGYKDISPEELEKNPNKRYLGESFYHHIRYEYKYKNKLQAGFNAEKDAGEMFRKNGYDFYSGYFLLKETGIIKTCILGNYRINFGQGLVINNDFSLGKSTQLSSVEKKSSRMKAHSSNQEYNFLQGTAATLKIKNITGIFFYSDTKTDANVEEETNRILSIKKDGLHRTENELSKKHAAGIKSWGSRIGFRKNQSQIGINMLFYQFDKPFFPEEKPYNYFYFRGKSNANLSLDYHFHIANITIFGETAFSQNRAYATLNGLYTEVASYCRLLFLYRNYAKNYHAFFSNAFSESGTIQNEKGFFTGLEINPFPYWKVSAYADIFSFPWLQYGTNATSSGLDVSMQASYSPQRNTDILFRYRYKNKETNVSSSYLSGEEHTYPIENRYHHRLRLQSNFPLSENIKAKSSLDYTLYHAAGANRTDKGWLLSQELSWKKKKPDMELSVQVKYFDTDNYNSRVYGYERNVLYAFSVPSYYGKGLRLVWNMRYHLNTHLSCWMRFSRTQYTDRKEIGSGLEKIEGNNKNDLSLLIRWKF